MDGSVDLSDYPHLMLVSGVGVCMRELRIPVVAIAARIAEGIAPADLAADLGVPLDAVVDAARYSLATSSFADLEPVRFVGMAIVTPPVEPNPNP